MTHYNLIITYYETYKIDFITDVFGDSYSGYNRSSDESCKRLFI